MSEPVQRPSILLDVDDVLCPGSPYGGHHVYETLRFPHLAPADLYLRLFSEEAVVVLDGLLEEFDARVVITSSWLSLFDRIQFEHILRMTGLGRAASNLHPNWDAVTNRGQSRLEGILRWLRLHHHGEPFVVLDDAQSGESLVGSTLEAAGRVVLCGTSGCLTPSHLGLARRALRTPVYQAPCPAPCRD